MKCRLTRVLLAGSLIIGTLLGAPKARAQDVAAAEALFNEGRRLLDSGDTAAACEKFAESQRLDQSPGTGLNLASCNQRLGRLATAWGQYLVAKRLAQGQGRQAIADEAAAKAAELEPQLSYVKLHVQSPPEGLKVAIGDTELAGAALGSKLPIDPGRQTLMVSAPDHQTLEQAIEVGEAGTVTEVIVPRLQRKDDASPAAAPPPTTAPDVEDQPPETTPVQADHTLAYVLGGVGVVGVAGGVVLGLMASSKNDEALDMCDGQTTNCPPGTIKKSDEAKGYSTAGIIVGGVGVVSLGVAAVLYFSGNEAAAEAARSWTLPGGSRVSWQMARNGASLSLETTF